MSLQLTLALIKPHVLKVPFAVEAIRNVILDNNFFVLRSKIVKLTAAEVEHFYIEHSKRFFYNRLVTFMQSGLIEAYILARISAIDEWRRLMGPTKVYQAQYSAPESLRGKFGLTDTRNALHGSDSDKSAVKEMSIIFPEFDASKWMSTEKECFEKGLVQFHKDSFVHVRLPQEIQS